MVAPDFLEQSEGSEKTIVPDVYVGTTQETPQYGVLGEAQGRLVAMDLNETHTVSLFGVQGGGKSYTLGSLIECAVLSVPPVNRLVSPLAAIIFHYSATQDYAPEFTSMIAANDEAAAREQLARRFGVTPQGLSDVLLLLPRTNATSGVPSTRGLLSSRSVSTRPSFRPRTGAS